MKNLDNPVTKHKLCGASFYEAEFNEHHGTDFKEWSEVVRVICQKSKNEARRTEADEFYACYLQWCKIANTKLYKALK